MCKNQFLAAKTLLGLLVVAGALHACGGKPEAGATPASGASGASGALGAIGRTSGAPVAISVVLAKQSDLDVMLEAIGTVTPLSSVEVKPQISSVVTAVHVKEGQFVKAGALLFTLDPRPDQANVAKARAQMLKDQALLTDAQRQLARSRDLLAKNFISQGALDSNQAQVDSQLANLAADRAALDAAQLALSYTSVRASGAGRLGAVSVYPGSAVQANLTSMLTITQLDPINISFNLPQRNLQAVLNGLQVGGAAVTARLPESKVELHGTLQFVDSAVDAATGTVKVRARFDNRNSQLWPGAFVNVGLVSEALKNVVVIPTAAVIQSTRGTIVYVVDKDKAILQPVKILAIQGNEAAVTGVAVGARVVVDGRQNLRPDSTVVERSPEAPVPAAPAVAPAPARAASSLAS